jgi:hypothetical protein
MIRLARASVLAASLGLGAGVPAFAVHATPLAAATRDAQVTLSVPALL